MPEDLVKLQNDIQIILDKNDISRYLDPKTISDWLVQDDIGSPRFISAVNMISGLLKNDFFDGPEKTEELLGVMMKISHFVNSKKLKKAASGNDLDKVYLMNIAIPPLKWMDVYEEAFHLASESKFHEAADRYDRTFLSLLGEETTDREPFRIFFNASNGYLFGGKPDLGMACLKYSLELNPNYPLARERIKALRSGKIDQFINLGAGSRVLFELGNEDHKKGILDVKSIPPWNLKVGLRSVGIRITKEDILTWSKKYVSVKDLIDNELDMDDENSELVLRSIAGLWSRYSPDEPYHELLEEIIWDIDGYIDTDIVDEQMEEHLSELEKVIFTGKNNFLADFPPFKEIRSYCSEAMMEIFMFMDRNRKLRKRGLKIARRLEKKTGNMIWSIPVIFLKEKDNDRLEKIVDDYRKDDHELVIIWELAEKFLDSRLYSSEPDGNDVDIHDEEDDISIFDDPPDENKILEEIMGGDIMEKFKEIAEDDSWKEKRNPDLLFHPASVYFRYLKGLGLNFRTERDVESEKTPLLSFSKKEGKIGRNDPCPCGSGKKYKKCCMKK